MVQGVTKLRSHQLVLLPAGSWGSAVAFGRKKGGGPAMVPSSAQTSCQPGARPWWSHC